jgi:hypothetical protein
MVFAIAALVFQFTPTPRVLVPSFAVPRAATSSMADGTKPKPATPPNTNNTTAAIPSTSGTGHLDLGAVSLSGDSRENATPGMTAVSLADDRDDENSHSLATVRIPAADPVKPMPVYAAEAPRSSRSWLALSLIQHGAATFDAYSTRQAIGHGAVEDDPMMRPFAHSGAIYAAIQVGPLVLDYVSRRMQHSEYPMVRRMWFVPQSVTTAGFLFSGVHNLNVANRP